MLTGRFAVIALLGFTLLLGLYGIGRSLWLDEAWVANSVRASTLSGMFHYPDWLQTSPPLFLLLARSAIAVFGLSTVVLRSVPLLLSLLAVAAMLEACRRAVPLPLAVLATASLAFHPTAVEYFRAFKQYGGEMAASALVLLAAVTYLKNPQRQQFLVLSGVVIAALALSYPTVFLLPGVVVAVAAAGSTRRAIALAAISSAMLGVLYWWFVSPNLSPELQAYWGNAGRGTLRAVLICGAAAAAVIAASARKKWMYVVCITPLIPLVISQAAGWYPNSPRTSLFIRPCLILLLAMAADDLAGWMKLKRRLPIDAIATLLAVVVIFLGVRKQFHEGRFQPEEDMAGAVRYLRLNVAPADLVLVHASLREGFELYTAMQGWTARPAIYGDTEWPCCPRGKSAGPDAFTPQDVMRDLETKVPRDFRGRVWLFYTDRPLHWDYVHVYDPKLWQNYFWSRGCSPGPYLRFPNLGLIPMNCS